MPFADVASYYDSIIDAQVLYDKHRHAMDIADMLVNTLNDMPLDTWAEMIRYVLESLDGKTPIDETLQQLLPILQTRLKDHTWPES